MSTKRAPYDAAIKTRVEKSVREGLEQVANNRNVDLADIARDAFREYLIRNPPNQLELAQSTGKDGRKAA
jgi:hypothetical protein